MVEENKESHFMTLELLDKSVLWRPTGYRWFYKGQYNKYFSTDRRHVKPLLDAIKVDGYERRARAVGAVM